jgi:hypothetical protein
MDLDQIQNMLSSQYNNNQPANDYVSGASAQINNLTRSRVKSMLSKYATTGMNRSGISGVALNDTYANADEQLSSVANQGAVMKQQNQMQALGQMSNIAEYQDQKPGALDYLGSLGGQLIGTGLGSGVGTLGSGLAKQWLKAA